MNFFERRKILKEVNYLDLIPVRMMESETLESGRVDVLLPRFKHPVLKKTLQPHWKPEHIRIHLDESGSLIWNSIDGLLSVRELCLFVEDVYPEKFTDPEETIKRVTQFLSLLYQERYISFRQIMKEEHAQ